MNYANGIKRARTNANLSKRKLASLANCDPSFITHIESGRKKPSLDVLERIADAAGTSVTVLMLLSADVVDLKGVSTKQAAILGDLLQTLAQEFETDVDE